jgi:hypothetical protein
MLDKGEQKVIDDIARYGWHLISVKADEHGPGFVYSVGMMHTLSHPEIIMFGLDNDFLAAVINDMGRQIRAGRNFAALGLFEDLLEGCACKVIEVSARWHSEYLGFAMWHRCYAGQPGSLRALECLWPDKQGRFPDEAGCHPGVVSLQPVLGI